MPENRGVKLSLTASFPNQKKFRNGKTNLRKQTLTKFANKSIADIEIYYKKRIVIDDN